MIVIGVDPGPTQSAFVVWDGKRIIEKGIYQNKDLRYYLGECLDRIATIPNAVVFEQVESFGMAVGKDIFETVFETGRLFQVVAEVATRLPRKAVKMHLCQSMRAKDSNIRQALIDRFGGSKAAAIGLKRTPGPLYGVRSHEWSALALAVTWFDKHEGEKDDDEKESHEKEDSRTEARQSSSGKEADGHVAGDVDRRRRAQQPGTGVRRRTRRKAPGGSR